MLCLSRKLGEVIHVGPPGPKQIVVTVLEITRSKVRLGIEAPRDMLVLRGELEDEKAGEFEQRVN
jgi:carbon storage regulator